jgi:hypothetical protein
MFKLNINNMDPGAIGCATSTPASKGVLGNMEPASGPSGFAANLATVGYSSWIFHHVEISIGFFTFVFISIGQPVQIDGRILHVHAISGLPQQVTHSFSFLVFFLELIVLSPNLFSSKLLS